MARPPRQAPPRKRTALDPVRLGLNVAADRDQAPPRGALDPQVGIDQLLQQFESALREDPAIDSQTRELLQQQFKQAHSDADLGSGSGSVPAVLDRSVWLDAIQALQANGAVAENEVNELIRQFEQALQPLQRRESRLAIEFSRRIQTEGQEKALAWFRQETSKGSAESTTVATPSPMLGGASPLLRSEVIHSRSRRLRGPPKN